MDKPQSYPFSGIRRGQQRFEERQHLREDKGEVVFKIRFVSGLGKGLISLYKVV